MTYERWRTEGDRSPGQRDLLAPPSSAGVTYRQQRLLLGGPPKKKGSSDIFNHFKEREKENCLMLNI